MTTQKNLFTNYTTQFIQENLPSWNKHILDVGCGEGLLSIELAEKGAKVLGIDPNFSAIETAKNNGANVLAKDIFDFKAETETYDAILFSRSLHHIFPIEKALNKCYHLLKKTADSLLKNLMWKRWIF